MTRDYPERPIVGVGVVIWRDDQVLLIRRGKPPRQGEWSLPGGAQKLGETLKEAAHREVREETGLEISIVGLVDAVDAIFTDGEDRVQNHYTLIDYVATHVSGEANPASDATDAIWITLNQLDDYLDWQETKRVIQQSAFLVGHVQP